MRLNITVLFWTILLGCLSKHFLILYLELINPFLSVRYCYNFEITFLGNSRIHSRGLQAEADLEYVDQQHSDRETPGSHLHENGIAF